MSLTHSVMVSDQVGSEVSCKRRSDNVPRRRLDSLNVAVENRTVCLLLLSDYVHTNC